MPGIPPKLLASLISGVAGDLKKIWMPAAGQALKTGAIWVGGPIVAGAALANATGTDTASQQQAFQNWQAQNNPTQPYQYTTPTTQTVYQPYQYKSNDDPVTLAGQYNITPAQLIEANPGGYPFQTGQEIRLPQQVQIPQAQQAPKAINPSQPYGGFTPAKADNKDYANTAAARYYDAAGTPFMQQQRWDPQAKKYVSIGRLIKQGKLDLQGNWNKQSRRQRQAENKQPRKEAQDNTLTNSFLSFNVGSG